MTITYDLMKFLDDEAFKDHKKFSEVLQKYLLKGISKQSQMEAEGNAPFTAAKAGGSA